MKTQKERIAELIEYRMKEDQRVYGNSEALDWIKLSAHKIASELISFEQESQPRDRYGYPLTIANNKTIGQPMSNEETERLIEMVKKDIDKIEENPIFRGKSIDDLFPM
jgi:hypothetical protein